MKSFRMNILDWAAVTLVVIGAFNWGLVGLAHFIDAAANWNLVNILFQGNPELEFGIYILVGLASLWMAYLGVRLGGVRVDDIAPESDSKGRGTSK